MADFTAAVTSGVTPEAWVDPGLGEVPSRINFDAEHPQLRLVATVGIPVVLTATVDGVAAPLDAALGGRLFTASVAERPGGLVVFSGAIGQSSVQTITPNAAGHYTFVLRREQGGGIWIHIDARTP